MEILPHLQSTNNQIAILCGLTASHVAALKLEQNLTMECSAIMAHLFFTASKLADSQPIIFVRPEFFSTEVVGLDTLDNFVVGDINTWDKAFFIINTTKRSVNWSLAIYHRSESLRFFDPSIHHSSDANQRGRYRRQRSQLFQLILAVVGRLHELDGTVTFFYFSTLFSFSGKSRSN